LNDSIPAAGSRKRVPLQPGFSILCTRRRVQSFDARKLGTVLAVKISIPMHLAITIKRFFKNSEKSPNPYMVCPESREY
jgi:hypothetical protein